MQHDRLDHGDQSDRDVVQEIDRHEPPRQRSQRQDEEDPETQVYEQTHGPQTDDFERTADGERGGDWWPVANGKRRNDDRGRHEEQRQDEEGQGRLSEVARKPVVSERGQLDEDQPREAQSSLGPSPGAGHIRGGGWQRLEPGTREDLRCPAHALPIRDE